MKRSILFGITLLTAGIFTGNLFAQYGTDVIKTPDLNITFLGHGSLLFEYDRLNVYSDPSGLQNIEDLPKADIVLITHEHGDHFNPSLLEEMRKESTVLLMNDRCAERIDGATVMRNGDSRTVMGLTIDAVPSYNLVHKNDNGEFFHPKGRDNGYVITFGGKRVYVAGDTENHPEMKALQNIDIAFLPMNLPYTMTPEMVADAAQGFKPDILYLYHYRDGDTEKLQQLMKDVEGVDLRIKKMYR